MTKHDKIVRDDARGQSKAKLEQARWRRPAAGAGDLFRDDESRKHSARTSKSAPYGWFARTARAFPNVERTDRRTNIFRRFGIPHHFDRLATLGIST